MSDFDFELVDADPAPSWLVFLVEIDPLSAWAVFEEFSQFSNAPMEIIEW
jgi:hypothetical protein